ncbi:carboxypeptidase-like regulatory domain-containing protein [Aspergillus fijiensis CBS 313.89]|uniref:Uncharacterized protein n=1 Tax=Aspergillus fijiensis CBS 313.89 TaxID=1448319 RepID=A0A8G1RVS3_9EURO|nr:uncharacterized protein BO72DRAFT_495974 [Aspergillus fijiensis CBS 313.89]RAK77676.1 hypothetical protein BO72DRAFT_495974 [Aspergillus fijiensis CBS 313.89]
MPESIIKILRFEGKADGWFDPPREIFDVPREQVFSAARITVVGEFQSTVHEVSIFITAGPDNIFVNSINTVVTDKKPSVKGDTTLSHLVPGVLYNVNITAKGFATGERTLITVELLELDSTVANVTRDILLETESQARQNNATVNALTFGISEASFAHFMVPPKSFPEVEIGRVPFLKVRLSMETLNYPWYPILYIDVSAEELVMAGYLQLAFYRSTDQAPFSQPVAVVLAQVLVRCRPAMVTTTEDSLELQFRHADLLNPPSILIHDPSAETGVLGGGYPSIADFEAQVNGYVTQMITKDGPLGFALPAYLESRALPDYWDHVLNMRLEFLKFKYETVQVHGRPVSYLFIIFSMNSLGLPPACHCDEPSVMDTASEMGDNLAPTVFEALQHQAKQGRPLSKIWSKVTSGRTDYTAILGAAQVAAFGMSQKTFREAAKPYAFFGHDQSSSTSKNGAVYASVRFWYSVSLKKAEITDQGIRAVIDIAGEGSAKAAVRDKCGHDVLRASERLRITLRNNSIKWRPSIEFTSKNPREITIAAIADAHDVGKPEVELDFVGGPPPPLDQTIDWVLTQIAEGTKGSLGKMASDQLTIRLVRSLEDNGAIRLQFVENDFFKDEALVLLGRLWSRGWE